MVRVVRFVRLEPKSRRKVSNIVVFHYVLWSVFVLHRAIEFLKCHLVMAGVGVGLTIGLVIEFFGDLPVFSTSGISASLLLNLGMLALCWGFATYLFPTTLRRFNAEPNGEVVNVLMLMMGWVWAALFATFGFIVLMDGWLEPTLWLLAMLGGFMTLFTLVVVLSALGLKWPDEFLQAVKSSVAWRHERLAEKFETGRLGRWIDRLSRRDSVRE